MNIQEQEKHFDEFVAKMKDTLIKKGSDYSNANRLSNFELAGNICGLSPELNCLSLIATKVARLGVLLQDITKKPNNESIRDSVLDLTNYGLLLDMILSDKEKSSTVAKSSGH